MAAPPSCSFLHSHYTTKHPSFQLKDEAKKWTNQDSNLRLMGEEFEVRP